MNYYSFSDCYIGQKENFEVFVSEDKMNMFREITGDVNPLHMDEDFAREHNYKSKVAFGLLTSSFTSTLAGVYIPGERSLIHEVSYKYMKPVFVNDTLLVEGEVTELDDRSNQITLKVRVRRVDDGVLVVRGKMIVGFIGD